jgi:hypothetical protein
MYVYLKALMDITRTCHKKNRNWQQIDTHKKQ